MIINKPIMVQHLYVNMNYQQKKGFAVLISVLILGTIGLVLALSVAASTGFNLQNVITRQDSFVVRSLVNAGAEGALQQIRSNTSFTGSGTVTVNGNTCNYTVANTGGSTRQIQVTGTVNNITRKITINISALNPTISISSWQEAP